MYLRSCLYQAYSEMSSQSYINPVSVEGKEYYYLFKELKAELLADNFYLNEILLHFGVPFPVADSGLSLILFKIGFYFDHLLYY